mgnify:CR=1 FL=1
MRENISCDVGVADRERLLALVVDRNTPAKVVWRAKIILATAKPSWVHVEDPKNPPQSWKSIAYFDEQVLCESDVLVLPVMPIVTPTADRCDPALGIRRDGPAGVHASRSSRRG